MAKLKVNRLFHWLYACVMFAPIVAVGATLTYTAFNDNYGTNQEVSYYESNVVTDYSTDIVAGNIYHVSFIGTSNARVYTNHIYYNARNNLGFVEYTWEGGNPYVDMQPNTSNIFIYKDNSYYAAISLGADDYEFDFIALPNVNYMEYSTKLFIEKSDLKIYKGVQNEVKPVDFITSAYTEVWDKPIFSWCKSSFINEPFGAVSTLFGMSADNAIVYNISYWFSISIIWLVFDVLMYVPLLVHRWIDKGSIS